MTSEEAIARIREHMIIHKDKEPRAIYITEALEMAIKALKQEQKWIPVSERLPEVDVDVLVTDNGGGVPTVIVDACGMKDDTGERFWYISQTPVAWMKLPEPYKAESEDKVNCDKTDCYNCTNHNYCDYETERSGEE